MESAPCSLKSAKITCNITASGVVCVLGINVGNSTLVENYIYLGSLKGSLAIPYVHISQDVRPDRYKITRDALDAVTLYAYAMAVAKALPESGLAI